MRSEKVRQKKENLDWKFIKRLTLGYYLWSSRLLRRSINWWNKLPSYASSYISRRILPLYRSVRLYIKKKIIRFFELASLEERACQSHAIFVRIPNDRKDPRRDTWVYTSTGPGDWKRKWKNDFEKLLKQEEGRGFPRCQTMSQESTNGKHTL